jgi:hypothetical protein
MCIEAAWGGPFSPGRDTATNRIEQACGFEVDPHHGKPASQLWTETPLN